MISANFHLLSSIFILHSCALTTSKAFQRPDVATIAETTRTTDARTGWIQEEDSWNYWWSYSGVSGPAYWGLLNSDWFMCDRGRRQSPIDVTTRALIYDPNLTALRADNNLISGILYNDGHSIVLNGSLAARVSFSSLERRKAAQAAAAAVAANESVKETNNGTNGAPGKSKRALVSNSDDRNEQSRQQQPQQQQLDQFVLVADANDFLVDVNERSDVDNKLTLGQQPRQQQHEQEQVLLSGPTPMLMRELSNNIELSISESDRLGSGGDGGGSGGADGGNENSVASLLSRDKQQMQSEQENQLDENSDQQASLDSSSATTSHVHFSGGPCAYSYRFESLQLKFGQSANNGGGGGGGGGGGSEHFINGRAFVAELQVLAYNWQFYRSFDEASTRPHGLLAISVLIDSIQQQQKQQQQQQQQQSELVAQNNVSQSQKVDQTTPPPLARPPQQVNEQLERLVRIAASSTTFRGHYAPIQDLNLSALLPDTEQFVTYEGSLTQPGCHESVTWLILNRPLYISSQSLDKLRLLSADEQLAQNPTGTLIAGNSRPVQPINNRPVRTNIRPAQSNYANSNKETCSRLWTRYEYRQSS